MIRKYLAFVLLMLLSASVFAQDEDFQSSVDYKVNKMQKELNLTDVQANAIRPIVKDYLVKRAAVLEEATGQGIVDHVSVKSTLKGLKETEYKKLGQILNEDQLKKLINKENLMATLNPDSVESTVDDDTALTASGANFKF